MKIRTEIYLVFCLVFFNSFVSAQGNFRFKNISINQGLSQSTVSDIVEDRKGMLWFATYDGLNKYNGKNFKIFRSHGASNVKLKSNKINKLLLAPNDLLFIYTDAGLDILNLKTERLIKDARFKHKKFDAASLYNDSTIIFSNRKGGLELYNTYTSTLTPLVSYSSVKSPKTVMSSILMYGEKIILIHQFKVQVLDKNLKTEHEYPSNDILQSARLLDHSLYVSCRKNGLLEINLKTEEAKKYKSNFDVLNVVKTELIDQKLYAMTYGQGMLEVDTSKKEFIEPKNKYAENQYISSSYQDKKNNIWIGTDGSGLNFFNKSQLIFSTITPQRLGSIRGVTQGENKLYVATFSNGCFSYDLATKKVEKVYHNPDKFCNAIAYNNDKLWIGYDHNGVDIYDLKLKKVVHHIPYFEKSLLTEYKSRIYRIDNLDDENMVICTRWEGMAIVNKKNYRIEKKLNQNNSTLQNSDIRYITLSPDKKRLYLGTIFEGLIVLSYPDLKQVKTLKFAENNQEKISVKHVREDSKGNIWVGTNGTGLLVFDKSYNEIAHWISDNYLKNDVTYASLAESNNIVWISSNEGIARLQYKLEKNKMIPTDIQNFNINNGLQSNEFNSGAYFKTKSGHIAFGGLDNLNVFDPKRLKFNRANSPVTITDFLVDNKAWQTNNTIQYLDQVKLSHEQNDIGISFIVPGYNEGIEIEYRYRLKGYQTSWQHIGSRNNVDFTNLPAGTYQFQVQSRYSNNFWSNEFTELAIDIKKPFYNTWWFYLLVGLGIILLVASIIRLRFNYLNNINKNKLRLMIESQEKERSRISRELHDDFGARLSTLKLHMEAIKVRPEQAQEIAKNTSNIIDQSIVELRNILLNLSPKTLSDDGLHIALQEIANSINKTKLIQVSSSYSVTTELKTSAAISIYRIVFELVNNTIKHAEASQIDFSLTQRKDAIVLHYEDNGKGMNQHTRSKGYGLSNINNHLQVHDAECYIDSNLGQGYHFTAEFPLNILM